MMLLDILLAYADGGTDTVLDATIAVFVPFGYVDMVYLTLGDAAIVARTVTASPTGSRCHSTAMHDS